LPKLSIITINLNNAEGLQRTIESVCIQSFKEIEFIIIDGGSTDGSLAVMEKYKQHIHYCLSEKDSGVYNAMNKGLAKATGDYFMFLNSGDRLANNNIIEMIMPQLTGEKIIYGDLEIEEPKKTWIKTYPDQLLFSYFIEDTLPHSGGVFIRKDAFTGELSFYDESLKITADWKWFLLAIFKHQYNYKHIPETIGVFDYSGMSAQPENHVLIYREKKKALEAYFPLLYKDMQQLLLFKKKYADLTNSRVVKFYLGIKQKMQRSK
jgi:glycosyltransferase involved in cell wall biosynthesis